MRLLVNHQLIPIAIQFKSISLEQICYKRSQGIAVTTQLSSFYNVKKQRPKTNLEKCFQCSVSTEISLDLKVVVVVAVFVLESHNPPWMLHLKRKQKPVENFVLIPPTKVRNIQLKEESVNKLSNLPKSIRK